MQIVWMPRVTQGDRPPTRHLSENIFLHILPVREIWFAKLFMSEHNPPRGLGLKATIQGQLLKEMRSLYLFRTHELGLSWKRWDNEPEEGQREDKDCVYVPN